MFQEFWSRFSRSPEKTPLIAKPLLALILEPDAVIFSLLADALKGEGFRVLQIRTASEAAVQVRREPIDLVFLNGAHSPSTVQTIEQMRRLTGPDSLTIIVAADPAAPGSAPELIAAGADDCLHQPLALSEVRNRVRARLRARGRRSFRDEPTPVEPGLVLDGKFRLVEELGRGNFGTVYSAVHLNLGELDTTERRDLLSYLLAVLRAQMSSKTVFGRHGQSGLTAVVASTGVAEANKFRQDAQAALADALTRVRPTKKTESFKVVVGYAVSPEDGLEPTSLLSLADGRMLSGD